jgi:amidase
MVESTSFIRRYSLSALIIPSDCSPTWASTLGLPGIIVPFGVYPEGTLVIHGLRESIDLAPGNLFGLTFLGEKWSEETTIGPAQAN